MNNPNGGPKDLEEFIKEYLQICDEGFIKSHRANDTGIGKTLEDLLHIEENDSQAPDFADYELKAHRINGSNSMTTLVTISPDVKGANNKLREDFGYVTEDSNGLKILHATLTTGNETGENALGLMFKDDKLYITSSGRPIDYAYYSFGSIAKGLKSKYPTGKAVFAEAISRGPRNDEELHYVRATLATGLNMNNFFEMIQDGRIKYDIRLGVYKTPNRPEYGRSHDHGSGFRIFPKDTKYLFDDVKVIVDKYLKGDD